MSEETGEKDLVIASLVESVEILREEVNQLRNSNRILRRVHSALRNANDSLRQQVSNAAFNDDVFKRYCFGEFDVKSAPTAEGGLPEAGGTVEPTV